MNENNTNSKSVGTHIWFTKTRQSPGSASIMIMLICLILAGAIPAPLFADAQSPDTWEIFRGNQQLTGAIRRDIPGVYTLAWTYETDDDIRSSPVIARNMVFVGSDDGGVHGLDLKTGKKVWVFLTDDAIEAPALVAFNTLYIGNLGGFFYALDILTGKVKWQFTVDAQISGSGNFISLKNGQQKRIAFGSYDNHLYCLDGETGKKVWAFEAESYINGSPSVYKENFVFGACDALVYGIQAKDGKKSFHIDAGSYIPGSVAIVGDLAFFGHYGNKLVCADLAKKKIVWEFDDGETSGAFFSSPAVNETSVVIGSDEGVLYCVDRQKGKLQWKYICGDAIKSSPVIAGNKVIFGSADGYVYILALGNGKKVWSWEIGEGVTGSPAVLGDMIVIGAEDGTVYAFRGDR